MDWKSDGILKAFRDAGYEVTYTDLMHVDSKGNENYNVCLQSLYAPEMEEED